MSYHLDNTDPCCCCKDRDKQKEKNYYQAVWGLIHGDITHQYDLIELIRSMCSTVTPEKEVINVLCAVDDENVPTPTHAGDLYINTDEMELYRCVNYAEEGEEEDLHWKSESPSEEVIYVTDDTAHIWIYDRPVFRDVTGEQIGDVIYIADENEDLKPYLEDGIYKVCKTYTRGSVAGSTVRTEWYTMTVLHNGRYKRTGTSVEYTQVLQNEEGYAVRTATQENGEPIQWNNWKWHYYMFEGLNGKRPKIEITFQRKDAGIHETDEIYIRDKNNAIREDDTIILYYWDKKRRRIAAFAGGEGDVQIWPVEWHSIASTSQHKGKNWNDDWRKLPFTVGSIMQRITGCSLSELSDWTWEGGFKKTRFGTISFVGGPRGNSYSTKLWIGIARDVSYGIKQKSQVDVGTEHFHVGELLHRIPFYVRCYHEPAVDELTEEFEQGRVMCKGSHSRKQHLHFGDELSVWAPPEEKPL